MTFEQFVRDRLPPVLRFAKVLCGERALAEDVVQDVLIRVQANWTKIEKLDKPDAYVRRMIVNEYVSWRRKWSRISPRAEVSLPESAPDPAREFTERDAMIAELAKLPPRQRAVLVLRYYGGATDAEIAHDLGCAESTVRAHAARALAAMRIEMRSQTHLLKEA